MLVSGAGLRVPANGVLYPSNIDRDVGVHTKISLSVHQANQHSIAMDPRRRAAPVSRAQVLGSGSTLWRNIVLG